MKVRNHPEVSCHVKPEAISIHVLYSIRNRPSCLILWRIKTIHGPAVHSRHPQWRHEPAMWKITSHGFFSFLSFFLSFLSFLSDTQGMWKFQARDWIRAAAAGHSHSHSDPDPRRICNLHHHSSWQHQILRPLSEARNWTCILMATSWNSWIFTIWIHFMIHQNITPATVSTDLTEKSLSIEKILELTGRDTHFPKF